MAITIAIWQLAVNQVPMVSLHWRNERPFRSRIAGEPIHQPQKEQPIQRNQSLAAELAQMQAAHRRPRQAELI
jgi:hypothetical protein